ncbi:MAG: hypothetical protein M3Y69_10540 [Verrucomicrobiota bacterium]|nr:hypothetical protein [Verrucomicrobiota bacterium]
MNRTSPLLVAALAVFTFTAGIANTSAETRENKRLYAGKITKNEAQHLVLQKFPGSKIKRCELTGPKSHSVIMIELIQPGAKEVTKVQVDGRTGKIAQ